MSRFGKEAQTVARLLKLKRTPIAGKFSARTTKDKGLGLKLSICEALDKVKREEIMLSITKENCTCAGGRHFTGLQIVPIETLVPAVTAEKHRVYDSKETAFDSIAKQPQPVKRGEILTIGPLEKFESDPDLVLLFLNPAQADRMLGLTSFRGAEPFMYYPASSICSTITNVLAKNKPEINLISTFERKAGKWSPNELVLAMPLKTFEAAIDNIPESGYGTFNPGTQK